jgi:hypothetical protein
VLKQCIDQIRSVLENFDPAATPLTLKIDARTGISTGISAQDRARTVAVAIDDASGPGDLKRGYGHVDGLRARERNFDLGSVRLADIAGNEHVVERTLPIMRRHPKDSIFACMLLQGEAFFYQAGRCVKMLYGNVPAARHRLTANCTFILRTSIR